MSANSPYSAEHHVRIMPAPDLYHKEVVAGTSISLQWTSVDANAQYDILYQRILPEPAGNQVIINAGSQRIWNLSGLEEQSVYVVQVRARDSWGNPSLPTAASVLNTGTASPTDAVTLPTSLRLQIYPMPFVPGRTSATIDFSLPKGGQVELVIYDVRGKMVRKLFHGTKSVGTYAYLWDGHDDRGRTVAAGIYVGQLRAGERTIRRKLVLIK